jgi:DNA replication protein DnaC
LLVIDDLGQQKSAENWLDDILFRIIDARYQNKRVTIITSNIELQKLRLDDRVSDRLNKMCQTIPLPDFSYRQKESKKKKVDFFKEMGLM